ncbi:MAG: hypothetical protein L3J97_02815 [Thermoplasmata archaeon]|nr:hypothetical protein [Thermoplasmata archaeon]
MGDLTLIDDHRAATAACRDLPRRFGFEIVKDRRNWADVGLGERFYRRGARRRAAYGSRTSDRRARHRWADLSGGLGGMEVRLDAVELLQQRAGVVGDRG